MLKNIFVVISVCLLISSVLSLNLIELRDKCKVSVNEELCMGTVELLNKYDSIFKYKNNTDCDIELCQSQFPRCLEVCGQDSKECIGCLSKLYNNCEKCIIKPKMETKVDACCELRVFGNVYCSICCPTGHSANCRMDEHYNNRCWCS